MKRTARVLAAAAAYILALCMGMTALAADTDTGEPMETPSHTESDLHGTKEEAAIGGPTEFERNSENSFSAPIRFYLRIENSPHIGPPGDGGGGGEDDSVRILAPLDLPDDLKIITDLPVPLSIPNTCDGSLPAAAMLMLAVSGAGIFLLDPKTDYS